MVLLKHNRYSLVLMQFHYLHSNMVLLKQITAIQHNISLLYNLHSNMVLLKPTLNFIVYLLLKIYIPIWCYLNPYNLHNVIEGIKAFTFQYGAT